MTPPTLNFALQNTTTSNNVFAFITGRAIDNNYSLFLLQADGKTPYYPTSPSATLQPLGVNCAIRLGAPGSTTTVTIPRLAGARLWFSVDQQLVFKLNPGPALVEPSVTNQTDPNYNINWGFCEFTYNSDQIYANISYVDFVSLAISLTLQTTSENTQTVLGVGADGLNRVCQALRDQDGVDRAGWSQLIVSGPNGGNLRALSPNSGRVINSALFQNYFEPYVDQVWQRYTTSQLFVNTQSSPGTISGTVNAADGLLHIGAQTYRKPSTSDILSCSTGPFATSGSDPVERLAAIPRLAAGFNRSTLLADATTPSENVLSYYRTSPTNHYSRILHAVERDGRGYAFPYDDVAPNSGGDVSGSVFAGDPTLLIVNVGGGAVGLAEADVKKANIGLGNETGAYEGSPAGDGVAATAARRKSVLQRVFSKRVPKVGKSEEKANGSAVSPGETAKAKTKGIGKVKEQVRKLLGRLAG